MQVNKHDSPVLTPDAPTGTQPGTHSARSLRSVLIAGTDSVVIQGLRYIMVGAIATVADVSTLYFSTERGHISYLISAAMGFVVGVIVNYLLSIKWVFQSRRMSSRFVEFVVFTVIGLIGLGLTELTMLCGVEVIGMHYMPTKICAVFIVFAWNFGVRRSLLFRGKESHD